MEQLQLQNDLLPVLSLLAAENKNQSLESLIRDPLKKTSDSSEALFESSQSQKILGKMKNFSEKELKNYLSKISDKALYAYNVYQIEGEGRKLFSHIDGDKNTIMGLPINKIKEYLKNYE